MPLFACLLAVHKTGLAHHKQQVQTDLKWVFLIYMHFMFSECVLEKYPVLHVSNRVLDSYLPLIFLWNYEYIRSMIKAICTSLHS